MLDGSTVIDYKGLDTRVSSIENWNGSWTGYYMQKFTDPDPNIIEASMPQFVPWPFFTRISFRAGMPAVTVSSQDALREVYRHERRIEMVYEEQRYHDTRRWMIAPQTLGRKTTYIKVTGKFKPGKSMSPPYHYNPSIYTYTYTPTVETAQEDRKWDDKIYFRPFSCDEINRNKELKQNPGY